MPEGDTVQFLEANSLRIVKISIPVVATLILDACIVRFLEEKHGSVSLDRSLTSTMSYSQQGISTTWSIYLALILIGAIVIVTAIIVLLYYYGCIKIIMGWMIFAVTAILSYYVVLCLGDAPRVLNVPLDWVTLVLVCANLVVVGDMAIFWRAPLIVTQVYLVFISVLIALVFLDLPDWTVWILLGLLVIYDALVVLCPHGLLNLLIKKSEERGDELPALIYSSAAWLHGEGEEEEENEGSGSGSGSGSGGEKEVETGEDSAPPPARQQQAEPVEAAQEPKSANEPAGPEQPRPPQRPKRAPKKRKPQPNDKMESPLIDPEEAGEGQEKAPAKPGQGKKQTRRRRKKKDDDEERGVRLGLGDFCFYGILVTRAARLGWDLVILCIFAVILGLGLTLLVLAFLQRPLPALPFSLILGVIFFMTGAMTFRPFDLQARASGIVF